MLEARLQAGVLDGDAGRGGQRHRQPLVLDAELVRTLLVGEVQAPDGFAAPDGHAEERSHLRVPGRKPLRQRVLAQVAQPHRLGIFEEDAEDALELRKAPDGRVGLVVDAARDEICQLAVLIYDAQGAVPRVYQLAGRLDDPLQDRGQAQVGGDAEHRVEQLLEAHVEPLNACHHRPFWPRSHHLGRVSATKGQRRWAPALPPAPVHSYDSEACSGFIPVRRASRTGSSVPGWFPCAW